MVGYRDCMYTNKMNHDFKMTKFANIRSIYSIHIYKQCTRTKPKHAVGLTDQDHVHQVWYVMYCTS